MNMSGPHRSAPELGAGVVITVLATLAIAAVAYAGASAAFHRTAARVPEATPTPQPPVTSPAIPSLAPSPVPQARAVVRDAYALDASTAWVLVTDCIQPMAGQCSYSIASTLDGGKTWSPAVQVGPMFDPGDGNAPSSVRFVNRLDGFVNGADVAYVTHDAGRTWHSSGLPAAVFDGFAVMGGTAWAVTNPCGKGLNCQWEVRSSPDGGRTWTVSHSLPPGFSPFDEVAFRSGLLISSVPFGDMEITTDGGSTWRSVKAPCTGNPFRGFIATPDGVELWEACMGPSDTGDSAGKKLFVSEDGGRSWSLKAGAGAGAALPDPGVAVVLVSNRHHVAFAGTDRAPVSVTRDGGATWAQVGFGFVFTALMFTTQDAGWALDAVSNLWTTADGGAHWTQLGPYSPTS
jgi:photosystem II stability/assembly factor-like uncharacterized protein